MNDRSHSIERALPQRPEPWQLQLFRRSLKKQEKLRALLAVLGPVPDQACLLITCGDNNGALNWHVRQAGGHWTWAEMERASVDQIAELTGDPVAWLDKEALELPFPNDAFGLVVAIDVHEHLPSPQLLNRELARVVRPGGKMLVTTPSGDPTRLANRIKRWVGMRREDYGHVVDGYDIPDLERQLSEAGLHPRGASSYSGFFTELVELAINFAYVKLMNRRRRSKAMVGSIAPQTQDQLKSVGKSYWLYSWLFPLVAAVARLDNLAGARPGHAVIVVATRD